MVENYSSLYAVVGFPSITEPAHILCDLLGYELIRGARADIW